MTARVDAVGLMEERLFAAGFYRVAGADEVGRGALAGPLVAAAVILDPAKPIDGLRDSKMCTRAQRNRLAAEIREKALAFAIVSVRPDKIDRRGLNPCNIQALRRALRGLEVDPEYALVDGFKMRRLPWPNLSVKKGDAVSRNVAAASIVAKVHRDRSMARYARRHPGYGFATNVGYGTREHWDALIKLGPSPIHRRSFYGVTGFSETGKKGDPIVVHESLRHLEDGGFGSGEVRNWELEGPLQGPSPVAEQVRQA